MARAAVYRKCALPAAHGGDALRHLDSITEHYEKNEAESFSAYAVIDALLSHYVAQIRLAGVEFAARVPLPEDTGIDNYDPCIVLGNLLDNGLAAAKKHPKKSDAS